MCAGRHPWRATQETANKEAERLPWRYGGSDTAPPLEGLGFNPCLGTKIPHAVWWGQNKLKKKKKDVYLLGGAAEHL